jgi:methionyl-tRNA formyltransferase
MKPLSFIFFGTPDIAAETLQVLFDAGYIPKAVVTGPDRAIGRHQSELVPTPAKEWAATYNIEVLQPEKIDDEFLKTLKSYNAEVFIVVAYGKILPEQLITMPHFGTLNIHYSLLPRWRGASPVEAAILAGDLATGVTIQSMVYELDAGDILSRRETDIDPEETTPQLRSRLSALGSELLVETLTNLEDRLMNKESQNPEGITKCGKIKKTDGEVEKTDDPEDIYLKWRAYQPWPGIYYFDDSPTGENKRVKITEMKRMNGIPKITKYIPEGGKEVSL